MTVPLFLAPRELLETGDRVVLDGPEGRHAAAVRRIGLGEEIDVADGDGLRVRCRVVAAGRTGLELTVLGRTVEPPAAPRIVVAQALAKGDRGELAVELLTEVGADEIVPWSARRCVTRWSGERGQRALARWRSAAREAAKQARRARVPVVTAGCGTPELAGRAAGAALAVVLDGSADEPLAAVAVPHAGELLVVVGPEGGVDPEELEVLSAAGAHPCRLGATVLRTSTAGAAAVSVLSAVGGRWR